MESLIEAKRFLRENFSDGVDCPCCGQTVKMYRRKLYGAMAYWLIWLVTEHRKDGRWYSVNESPIIQNRRGGGDFAKLEFWGLISEKPNDDDSGKRTSGMWKPTEDGILFAKGMISVPSHVFLYNNKIAGWSDTKIDIRDALGTKFNYDELMGSG